MNSKRQKISNTISKNYIDPPSLDEITQIMNHCLDISPHEKDKMKNILSSDVWNWVFRKMSQVPSDTMDDMFNALLEKFENKIQKEIEALSTNGVLLNVKLSRCEYVITHYWTILNNISASFYFIDNTKEDRARESLIRVISGNNHWLKQILLGTDIEVLYENILTDPEIPYNMEYLIKLRSSVA